MVSRLRKTSEAMGPRGVDLLAELFWLSHCHLRAKFHKGSRGSSRGASAARERVTVLRRALRKCGVLRCNASSTLGTFTKMQKEKKSRRLSPRPEGLAVSFIAKSSRPQISECYSLPPAFFQLLFAFYSRFMETFIIWRDGLQVDVDISPSLIWILPAGSERSLSFP